MGNQINKKRTSRIQQKSSGELKRIVDSKSLSSAAALYELRKRGDVA